MSVRDIGGEISGGGSENGVSNVVVVTLSGAGDGLVTVFDLIDVVAENCNARPGHAIGDCLGKR